MKNFLFAALSGCLCLCCASADEDYDLRINGDFRGAAANAALAPGWSVSPGDGSTRVIPGEDYDEFAIEITGGRDGKTISTDFYPVHGNAVKLETEIKGSGAAQIGVAAFGADKKPLFTRTRIFNASAWWSTAKNVFRISEPEVKFVKIVLCAEPGSTIAFADVDAEFKRYAVPSVPAQTPAPAVAPQPAQTIPPTATLPSVIHEKCYSLDEIGAIVRQATVPLGGEIDFALEEDASRAQYWTISSYDSAVCRVEIEHDREGIWPFRRDLAKIELKGVAKGTTTVLFTYPDGKNFQVLFTVR